MAALAGYVPPLADILSQIPSTNTLVNSHPRPPPYWSDGLLQQHRVAVPQRPQRRHPPAAAPDRGGKIPASRIRTSCPRSGLSSGAVPLLLLHDGIETAPVSGSHD